MPSLTSVERHDPPARRKSCLACTKSRRRCDQARPACQRCSQRKIECRYSHGANPAPPTSHPESEKQTDPGLLAAFDTPDCFDMLDSILEPTDDFTAQLFQDPLEGAGDVSTHSLDYRLANSGPRLQSTAQEALGSSQLVHVPQVKKAIASRLQYAIDKISAAPCQMVLENQMPWCHAHLYDDGMPRCMQCALPHDLTCTWLLSRLTTESQMLYRLLRCPQPRTTSMPG